MRLERVVVGAERGDEGVMRGESPVACGCLHKLVEDAGALLLLVVCLGARTHGQR